MDGRRLSFTDAFSISVGYYNVDNESQQPTTTNTPTSNFRSCPTINSMSALTLRGAHDCHYTGAYLTQFARSRSHPVTCFYGMVCGENLQGNSL